MRSDVIGVLYFGNGGLKNSPGFARLSDKILRGACVFKRLLKLWFVPLPVHEKLLEDYGRTLSLLKQLQEERDKLAKAVVVLDHRVAKSEALRNQEFNRFKTEIAGAQKSLSMVAEAFELQRARILKLHQAVEKGNDIAISRIPPDSIMEGDDAIKQAMEELAAKGTQKLN